MLLVLRSWVWFWILLTLDVRQKLLVLGEVGDETLDGTADHGVLAHEDYSLTSQRGADFVHLLGRHTIFVSDCASFFVMLSLLVNADNEDGLVLVEQALELVEVDGCSELAIAGSSRMAQAYPWFRICPPSLLRMQRGYFRAN